MNRKIEVGCMVMVHGLVESPEMNGRSGMVTGWEHGGFFKDGHGEIYFNNEGGWLTDIKNDHSNESIFSHKNLMRIDDPDLKEEVVRHEEEEAVHG